MIRLGRVPRRGALSAAAPAGSALDGPLRVLVVLLALGGWLGCTRGTPAVVTRLEVDGLEAVGPVGLGPGELRERLLKRLEAVRVVVLEAGQAPPPEASRWSLRAAAVVGDPSAERAPDSAPRAVVVLHLRREGAPEGLEVRASVSMDPLAGDVEEAQAAAREALDAALGRAVREAKALIELERVEDGALRARLGDGDAAVRDAAARLLVRRGSVAALPVLLERLQAEDLETVRWAVGLLVELKAEAAVNPMIEATRRQGPMVEREIVFAVGAIGGDDAEAYLDLIASGHDDPVVRASAEAALEELRAKRSKGAKP